MLGNDLIFSTCTFYDSFVATLASKELVDCNSAVNIFEFDKHFNLTKTQVIMYKTIPIQIGID